VISPATGCSSEYILWEMPLTQASFYFALQRKEQGVEGVGRKKDYSKILQKLKDKRNGKL